MQPTKKQTPFYQVTISRSCKVILAIHRSNPKLLVHWLRFHADFLFFLSKKDKKTLLFQRCKYIATKKECKLNEWQAARLTTSFDFLSTMSLSTLKYLPEKRYLSSLHFIHKSRWKIIQLFVKILTVNRSYFPRRHSTWHNRGRCGRAKLTRLFGSS